MSSKIALHCTREELPGLFRALANALTETLTGVSTEASTGVSTDASTDASTDVQAGAQADVPHAHPAEPAGYSVPAAPSVPTGSTTPDANSETYSAPTSPPAHCNCPAGTASQESAGLPPDALALLSGFRKMKISVKDEFGQVSVKIKFRSDLGDLEAPDCACGGTLPGGMPSYKSLKKRMRSSFKSVYQAVHAGRMPSGDAVAAFVAESRLMVQYPGYGDPYYAAYDTAVNAFEAAWQAQDIHALHAAVDALNHLKTDCHQRYK